ncbi:hypothetical protein [uncultured Thomasclavelia sp.]|uniref:hypothetical protein n=1 Tax=uncultured Thomasclavelia sp. TaxID=3025759 RepID=UPI00280A555C|nr:hypothetical protein [uncultured Thomasclavelia sp.]
MKKKVLIISYYDWWNIRQKYFAEWFLEHGYQVKYITSNFNHITKKRKKKDEIPPIGEVIEVPIYKHNLSLKRIRSNLYFSNKIKAYLKHNDYDIIICLIPCNSLGNALMYYRKKNPNVKIIIDILDLWPETLPFHKLKYLFSPCLYLWKNMRDLAIKSADVIITECSLFKQEINGELNNKKSYVLYLQKNNGYDFRYKETNKYLSFAYLGSINNIIDIDNIVKLLSLINKKIKVKLEIIGCGSSEREFIEKSKREGIEVNYHGAIFDEIKKHEILQKCHFGLNMMKESVIVGLTTKSMDYLRENLPLINSIPHDTKNLINKYESGININASNIEHSSFQLINISDDSYNQLALNAKKMFDENFSNSIYLKKLDFILKEIVKN